MEQMVDLPTEVSDKSIGLPFSKKRHDAPKSTVGKSDWGEHPLNIRISLPLLFGRWYVTLIAGRERRSKDRLSAERKKHSLETAPNLVFLFSLGVFSTNIMIMLTILVLVHGFGWTIQIALPA